MIACGYNKHSMAAPVQISAEKRNKKMNKAGSTRLKEIQVVVTHGKEKQDVAHMAANKTIEKTIRNPLHWIYVRITRRRNK